jgi:hypothetical protein
MTRAYIAAGASLVVAVLAAIAVRNVPEERTSDRSATAHPARIPAASAAALASAPLVASVAAASATVPARFAATATAITDPRVPAIDPPASEPLPAQPWEIADPALYKARERRLAQETNERFIQAADARLPHLLAALEDMKARDIAPADIKRAEDKIRHLQAVRDALVRGETLGDDGHRDGSPQAGIAH